MDAADKGILNIIQGEFPVSADPYGDIGQQLGLDGAEVLARVRRLKHEKIIRKVGPFFDARKMGHRSTLCAIDVPEESIDEVADMISAYSEVTHNYLREGHPNIWFTLIAASDEAIEGILEEMSRKSGIRPIRNLPARRMFKIKVDLKLGK